MGDGSLFLWAFFLCGWFSRFLLRLGWALRLNHSFRISTFSWLILIIAIHRRGVLLLHPYSRNLRKHLQHNYCIPFKRNFLLRPAIMLTHWNLHRSENHIDLTNSIDSISFFRNMRCWHHRPLTSATTIDSSWVFYTGLWRLGHFTHPIPNDSENTWR